MGRKLNSMNLESPKIIVKKSSEEIYDFLIEIKNFTASLQRRQTFGIDYLHSTNS